MPLTERRRKAANEDRPSAEVMAPTRMKLRVRRRGNVAGEASVTGGGDQPEEEESNRERGSRSSSRRKRTANNTTTTSIATSSSSASTSARAVLAAEEASPDSKCPICLDRFNNLAYLDRCLHRFCFPCIQEWSNNKAECPLCKQPFASILHSVRAEDDFKEYTLRPPPANSSVAASVAMVAAMASAARSHHQMRLMLRRRRGAETATGRRRRERGGTQVEERTGVWEWYLDAGPLPLPPLPPPALVAEDSEEAEDLLQEHRPRDVANPVEHGVIFDGLTGLSGAVTPLSPNDRESRRLMTRLAARQNLQREGGNVRRLRERETVAFRRALYRCSVLVRGVAGVSNQGPQQRDITAESFRLNPFNLNRLRPWLRRELTVLYGTHGSLVDIVQRIIMSRIARHGLEDTPTIEEELRPFLLARTDHFLHELVSYARSPLTLENYDLQAVYEPPAAAMQLETMSTSSDSSSVIAISEGEEEDGQATSRMVSALEDIVQPGSCLSLSGWDDETPGPSYSTTEPSCSLASLSFSPASQEQAKEGGGEKEEGEEECLIVGYKKPIAERTPELVQLSSDTEEEEDKDKDKAKEEKETEKLPILAPTTPPLSYLPIIPPSTSHAYSNEPDDELNQKDGNGEDGRCRSRARSWSGNSVQSRNSLCALSSATPGVSERQREGDGKHFSTEVSREKRRRKRSRKGRDRSNDRLRKKGTLYNPNRSIYPAMMRHRSHSPSLLHSSIESSSPLTPSPADSSWEHRSSCVSPPSSLSSGSSSSSPQPWTQGPPTPSTSPVDHGEKPGGKRKYKSRHLDNSDKDPTWRPSRKKGEKRRQKERRKRKRKEKPRTDAHSGGDRTRSCRDDRSPSVEIIYEGPVAANATEAPARKRRRKRKAQSSSSPVVITLDSDSSSRGGRNRTSASSSPVSCQQTVDFCDIAPLPLLHPRGMGTTLNAEIGELPVDILDRGSDGSGGEGPISVDNSDYDVDVENVESGLKTVDSGSRLKEKDLAHKKEPEVSTSDSNLLATILHDLKGITAPKGDHPVKVDSRKRNSRDYNEVSPACSNQDQWLEETSNQNPDLSDRRDQNQGLDFHISIPRLPPVGWLKDLRVREEGTDLPPLLKRASPGRSHNSNTPPPLKHKDAANANLLPTSHPVGYLSYSPVDSRWRLELPKEAIPPISMLKRCFSSAVDTNPSSNLAPTDLHLASQVKADTTHSQSHIPSVESPSAETSQSKETRTDSTSKGYRTKTVSPKFCQGEPIDSHSASHIREDPTHSLSNKLPIDLVPRPENGSDSLLPRNLDYSLAASRETSSTVDFPPGNPSPPVYFPSTKSVWSTGMLDPTNSTSEGCRTKPLTPKSRRGALIDSSSAPHGAEPHGAHTTHTLSHKPPLDLHSAKTGQSKETSKGCRTKALSPKSCRLAPNPDLHPSNCVSPHRNISLSAAPVSFMDSRTQSPFLDIDSSGKKENYSKKVSSSRVGLAPTLAASSRLSATDPHPKNPRTSVDSQPFNTSVVHKEKLPYPKPPSADKPPVHPDEEVCLVIGGQQLNQTSLSKGHNPEFPVGSCPKRDLAIDPHIPPSSSSKNQWNNHTK